jgi:hypothetical protein
LTTTDEVIAILLRGIEEHSAVGCLSYVVGACPNEDDRIWVTEV